MTAEEMLALPHAPRLDRRLLGGELVERAYPLRGPAHAATYASLCGIFGRWAATHAHHRWRMFGTGYPFRLLRNPDTLLDFDLGVCSYELACAQDHDLAFVDGTPVLAVEVVDLADTHEQVSELVDVSLANGVPCVWVVDPFEEQVKVYRPTAAPQWLRPGQVLTENEALPGFRCLVDSIFE